MSSGSAWVKVSDQKAADALLDTTHGFHDSIATKATWIGAEVVNTAGQLELRGYGVLYLAISSQLPNVAPVELRFKGIERFGYDYDWDHQPMILVNSEGIRAKLGAWEIRAHALEYSSAASRSVT